MGRLIEGVGPFALKPRRNRFHTLVRAIVSQQISTAAARSILAKLEAACEPEGLCPETLARLSPAADAGRRPLAAEASLSEGPRPAR